jgi:hypothetical protein
MFDSTEEPLALKTADLAGLIEQNHAELVSAECRMLRLACAWADAHYLDSDGDEYQPLIKAACAWGGEGTPEVSEYCAAELGALQGTGIMAARALIADALDLRYRLPRLWDRVLTGGVRAWQAHRIAKQTRPLSWAACADVDHALSDFVGMMPWPRFAKILSAAVLEADPELAAERAERARSAQDVFSFDSEDGLKIVVAKAAAGDAIWFLAMVNRIAEILAARGDADPIGMRRARAIGILAQPAEALRLLFEHQHDRTEQPHEANEPEPAEPDARSEEEPDATSGEVDESESDPEMDDHQSLSMTVPPAFAGKAARPQVVLHFHLSEAAVRTGHEVPQRLRAAVRLRQIADVFPFGTCLSQRMDLDHTERYVPMDYGGPPGQTRLGNLGPMARPSHRAVTHGGWHKHQPEPGYFVHCSPNGYVYLVTNQGTLALGRTGFSAAVWEAAAPKPAAIPA